MNSSQDSIQNQPPLKKQKQNPSSQQSISKEEQFQFSQVFNSSSTNSSTSEQEYKSIIIKKGDKIQKKISKLLKILIEEKNSIILMSSGENLQKLSSIIEILKLKLREFYNTNEGIDFKFEQFNKLDFYETSTKKNEILDKTLKVPVLYTMIRSINPNQDGFNDWTRQLV
ncbi:Ribonucleases P/MRP protein subunit [Wickerhamomyces ciferrii]|uniref:Ribonucleases P/MRP protein subunit n=1 Tax=Wickerhamomyces ciferrii (strain ATCC 14091 / BCRC 22168 / CBS 111 / JCM 3599 / NBRC 0793 / NRRL Y-1031 F-60-10) TaxID=1206466 RepID=K0KQK5_WICCF|nr:Ribonucleases P/MRP protein subunit [Wickerhamomyces ciferrii]CCH43543.1 Ribonucleases P/MRP protein subunit [Wickerhamomyces ciferrii]